MNTHGFFQKAVSALVLLAAAADLRGAITDLAETPLVTSSNTTVLPNLMFVLDDSGSMDSDYMPDWANSKTDYLFRNSGYNTIAYNPAINYTPPRYFDATGKEDKTKYPSQTAANTDNWTQIKPDGYGISLTCPAGTTSGLFCDLTLLPGAGPRYFLFKAGEYCKDPDLTVCNAQDTPDPAGGTYVNAAPLRWCKTSTDAAAATPAAYQCRAARIESGGTSANTYDQERHPSPPLVELTFGSKTNPLTTVTGLNIDGVPIVFLAATLESNDPNTVAGAVAESINAISTATGLAASSKNNVVSISQVNAHVLATLGPITSSTKVTVLQTGAMSVVSKLTVSQVPGEVIRVDIVPSNNSYPYPGKANKAQARGDCAGTTCTYAEEMTNYANWWAYYRTRMQMMKTATSRAFADIKDKNDNAVIRLGYFSINDNTATDKKTTVGDFLNIANYEGEHKGAWYAKLFNAKPGGWTPLRGALSRVGQMYGGVWNGKTLDVLGEGEKVVDPMQYSCQQNYTILSTDGYWNDNNETETYGPKQLDNTTNVGDQDKTEKRPMLDGNAQANTLADIAEYYYMTDLRKPGGQCTGTPIPPASGQPLCPSGKLDMDKLNNVPVSSLDTANWQHMTTFTLGLGASGYMLFDPSYETTPSGDFFSVKSGATANPDKGLCVWQNTGSCNWPKPKTNEQPNIDDLWHASVNGRGGYFSAGDPAKVVTGLQDTLDNISRRQGASAAAITSNPNITTSDNLIFSTTFATGEWSGQLIRQRFTDVESGTVPAFDPTKLPGTYGNADYNYDWSARDLLDDLAFTSRKIWVAKGAPADLNRERIEFDYDKLAIGNVTAHCGAGGANANAQTCFSQAYISTSHNTAFREDALPPLPPDPELKPLSQFCDGDLICLSADDQKNAASGPKLVDFLRGDRSKEGTLTDANRYYRQRKHVLGDIVDAETVYVEKPLFNYMDPGYNDSATSFVTKTKDRRGIVYAAANDGMLHAFDGGDADKDGGKEWWAYIPNFVLPKLYTLADKKYSNRHQFMVNGTPVVADICQKIPHVPKLPTDDCTGSDWRTILVGGLGGGGRGYYALDITDPSDPEWPKVLWEFTDAKMGYTYGDPIITKLKDGTWAVLVTSGYNNVPDPSDPTYNTADGKGYLYVLGAIDGKPLLNSPISTGAGTTTNPSGLARINTWVDDLDTDNSALRVYGGDLAGNLWRFDLTGADGAPQLLAKLEDANGNPQPITAAPELGEINGEAVVFIGTGRLLGISDRKDESMQTFYAIKDNLQSTASPTTDALVGVPQENVCGSGALDNCFVQQSETITTCASGTPEILCLANEKVRTSTSKPVNFTTGYGWFFDLPEKRERANTDPALVYGTLVFNTNVPNDDIAAACTGGGYSYRYFVDYRTGGALWPNTSKVNAAKLGDALTSRPVMVGLPTNQIISISQLSNGQKVKKFEGRNNASNAARRASWRELINE